MTLHAFAEPIKTPETRFTFGSPVFVSRPNKNRSVGFSFRLADKTHRMHQCDSPSVKIVYVKKFKAIRDDSKRSFSKLICATRCIVQCQLGDFPT